MVRRWTRINEFNFTLKNKKLFFLKKSAKSRIFKLTVSTRKFFKKYTKFRRKAFNRLRHRSNWLIYSNVLKFWAYDYINTKTFSKRAWALKAYNFNFIVFNWSSVKNLNAGFFFNLDYNLTGLNSFFLKQNGVKNFSFYFWEKIKNSSVCSSNDLSFNPRENENAASLFLCDDYFYEIENLYDLPKFFIDNFFFFINNNNACIKQQHFNLYKTLVYLTFLDLRF